ncbi:MAG: hypothetical protein ACREJQ_06730 [bacterium]
MKSLWQMAAFAFALGFAHEEEFALIGICTAGVNCAALITIYALAVSAAIIGLTLASIALYRRFEERLKRYEPYFPKIIAGVLVLLAIGYLLRVNR